MKKINKKELNSIAQEIERLESECQQGINVSENLMQMELLMMKLPFEEMLELTEILNKKFLTI